MHLKMLSALVVCCIYFVTFAHVSIEANSVDSDQTALFLEQSDLDPNYLLRMPLKHSRRGENRQRVL